MSKKYSLANVAQLKVHLPVRAGVTTLDERMKETLRLATSQIEIACRRSFGKREFTQLSNTAQTSGAFLDLLGNSSEGVGYSLPSAKIPLTGLNVDPTSIEVRYDRSGRFGDDTVRDARDYSYSAAENAVILHFSTSKATRALQITYEAGYIAAPEAGINDANWQTMADSAPDELVQACVMQALALWHRTAPNNVGLAEDQNSKNKSKFTAPKGLDPDVVMLVQPFRSLLMGSM